MENNIFKEAKFGDKFLTRDGRIAILIGILHNEFAINLSGGNYHIFCTDSYGTNMINNQLDIVSKYQEPINEKELDELAYNYACIVSDYDEIVSSNDISAYKAGYRKAKEE